MMDYQVDGHFKILASWRMCKNESAKVSAQRRVAENEPEGRQKEEKEEARASEDSEGGQDARRAAAATVTSLL